MAITIQCALRGAAFGHISNIAYKSLRKRVRIELEVGGNLEITVEAEEGALSHVDPHPRERLPNPDDVQQKVVEARVPA